MFYVAFLYNERMVQIKSKVAKVTPNLKLCTTQVFFAETSDSGESLCQAMRVSVCC